MPPPRQGPARLWPVVLAAAILAACSGGSTDAPFVNTGTAAPTPPPTVPSLAPATASSSTPLAAGSSAALTVAIPPAAGISGSIVLPAASIPANTTLTVVSTTTAPAGVATLSSVLRAPRATGSTTIEPLFYQGLSFTQTVTFPAFPALSIALPAGYNPALGTFGLAFYDGAAWSYPLGAPGVANGQRIEFASAPGPVTYLANRGYYFALYYQQSPSSPTPTPTASPAPTATPVPTASPVPTATPSPGPLMAAPSVLQFVGTGADLTKTVTLSSAFYSGTFSASGCVSTPVAPNPVASVGPMTPNGTFTVTPANVGACTIDITDAAQRHSTVTVTVSTSSLTVNSRKH
ncbi:MAG: hypothetical protein JWO66_2868 [Candidatus Eremiobacteraeota bacterium]|nr:hypothetical protein [Candidatus Eremiobacteraeota bacterium]